MKLDEQKRFLFSTVFFLNMSIYCIPFLIEIKTASILSLSDFCSDSNTPVDPWKQTQSWYGLLSWVPSYLRACMQRARKFLKSSFHLFHSLFTAYEICNRVACIANVSLLTKVICTKLLESRNWSHKPKIPNLSPPFLKKNLCRYGPWS